MLIINNIDRHVPRKARLVDGGKGQNINENFITEKPPLWAGSFTLIEEEAMKLKRKTLAILRSRHLVTDVNQGAFPALLPFFKEALNLSYTMSGVIVLSSNLTSSIIQPAFGYLSDRRPIGWFLALAPFIACLRLSIRGFASHHSLLLLRVILTGIGIASFNPEGFKTAYFFTGDKKVTGMSIFAVDGGEYR